MHIAERAVGHPRSTATCRASSAAPPPRSSRPYAPSSEPCSAAGRPQPHRDGRSTSPAGQENPMAFELCVYSFGNTPHRFVW